MQAVRAGNAGLLITTTPAIPLGRVEGWQLAINRGPFYGLNTYSARGDVWNLAVVLPGYPWTVGESVKITLYRPYEDIAAEDAREGATRSASACPGAVDAGSLWHCHGDAIYHQHGPEWRYRHPAPSQTVRPTGDPLARPPATAPASEHLRQGQPAEGFGNWHSHPDGRYHRHAGGH